MPNIVKGADIAADLDSSDSSNGRRSGPQIGGRTRGAGVREPVLDEDGQQAWADVPVWHCALSFPPGEVLSEDRWEQVTAEFMDGMGSVRAAATAMPTAPARPPQPKALLSQFERDARDQRPGAEGEYSTDQSRAPAPRQGRQGPMNNDEAATAPQPRALSTSRPHR